MAKWTQRLRTLVIAATALVGAAAAASPSAVADPATGSPPERADQSRDDAQPAPWSDAWISSYAERYLDDAGARRRALERSLTNPDNLYSRMRLAAYGRGRHAWDVLPAWNPRTRPMQGRDIDSPELDVKPIPLWDGERPETMDEWVALGRDVFERYPLRAEPAAARALARGEGEALGLQRDEHGNVPGMVIYADLDGEAQVGITCALCHATVEDGALVYGRARRTLDYGAMRLAYERAHGAVDESLARRYASWGPGRADITEDDDQDPVAIPDLWRLRELRHLTQAATIVHDTPLALALRQETQMLHASGERVRPPRELAWALTMFLYTLGPPPTAAPASTLAAEGGALFRRHCASCHRDANGSGPPVSATRVGVDAALADGTARGTGRYRPAPLVSLLRAGPYLHTGDVPSLDALVDPNRLPTTPGHAFGTNLPARERAALVAWLKTR